MLPLQHWSYYRVTVWLDAIDAMHVLYLLHEVHVYNNACIVTLWLDELKHDAEVLLKDFCTVITILLIVLHDPLVHAELGHISK